MRYATTEKVVNAWLAGLPGLNASMVDEQLPTDNTTWAASGFLTPTGMGGAADVYVPVAHPMVTVDCWAVDPDSGLPPWNKAANLAETVRSGTFTNGVGTFVTLPYSDQNARILTAYLRSEPRRKYGDIGDYACVTFDLALHWAVH